MKYFSYLLIVIPFLFTGTPVVEWQGAMEHDFGDLERDKPVDHYFKFKNVSGEPITIDNVRTTCGCTAPDWSFEPVMADSLSQLKITYDAHRTGYFRKKIKVFFNSQRKAEILYVEGYVLEE